MSFRARLAAVTLPALLLAAASTAAPAAAALLPGQLDPTFGGSGKVQVPFGTGGGAGGVAIQADGKILVAGSDESPAGFTVARLRPNGSLDPEWGGTGVVTIELGEFAEAYDVAVQPDGKVVAVGSSPGAAEEKEDFEVVRFLPNGELDPSFGGGDGRVAVDVGGLNDQARAVAIGPGGRIAVVGICDTPTISTLAAGVAVLESDGTPEAAFDGDGSILVETDSEGDDRAEGVAFQPDGKVLVADATGGGFGDGFTLIRLDLEGQLDSGFGDHGVVETPIPGEGEASGGRVSDVLLLPDGRIVGGGYGADYIGEPPGYVTNFALARYTPEGELDPSFGNGGTVTLHMPGSSDAFARALGLEPDGKLVLGGSYEIEVAPSETRYHAALARFSPDGTPDPGFGSGGIVEEPFGGGFEYEDLEGLAIQPDAKIVTGGSRYSESGPGQAIVSRYIGSPEAPSAPGPKSTTPRPDTNMRKVPRMVTRAKLKSFRGRASDAGGPGLRSVQVALVRVRRGHPLPKGRHWRRARGTGRWQFELRRPLSPGTYVVFSRAVDRNGLAENGFSRRDRNRYRFEILAP